MLSSAMCVLISLRAATVRQAQQTFSIAFFILFIPLFLIPKLPETWRLKLVLFLSRLDYESLVILGVTMLIILNLVFISLSVSRFKRARLTFV
jgi:ABC-2 type transport system permease protein